LPFSIDFDRRPYNTLALPCECVILSRAKFTFRPSRALSYIFSVTARHSSSGRQPNFAASSRGHNLYSAGRPSRWSSAHILVNPLFRLAAVRRSLIVIFRVSRRRREEWSRASCVVCDLSAAACPQYCTDPDVIWRNGTGCPLVVH